MVRHKREETNVATKTSKVNVQERILSKNSKKRKISFFSHAQYRFFIMRYEVTILF